MLTFLFPNQTIYKMLKREVLEPQWHQISLNCTQDLIEGGRVKAIISRLKHWSGQGKEVVLNFAKYKEAVSSICAL